MDHTAFAIAPSGRASGSPGAFVRRRGRTRGGIRRHLYRWSTRRALLRNTVSHSNSIKFDIESLPAVVRNTLDFEGAVGHGGREEYQVRTPPVDGTGLAETGVSGKTPFAGSPAVQSAASTDDAFRRITKTLGGYPHFGIYYNIGQGHLSIEAKVPVLVSGQLTNLGHILGYQNG